MNDIFKILDSFAAQFSPEVEGRCAEALDDTTRETLTKLCRGELDDGERHKAAQVLLQNPTAMEFLVSEISSNRGA